MSDTQALEHESTNIAVQRFLRDPLNFTSSPITMYDLLGNNKILCLVKVTSETGNDGFTKAKLCYSFYALIPGTREYVLISSKINFNGIRGLGYETICLPFPERDVGDVPYNPSKYIISPHETAPLSVKFTENKNPMLVFFSIFLRENPDVDVLVFNPRSNEVVNPIMDGTNYFHSASPSNLSIDRLRSMGVLECKLGYELSLDGLFRFSNMKKVCDILFSDPSYLDRYAESVRQPHVSKYDANNPEPIMPVQEVPNKPDWMNKMSDDEVALYVKGTLTVPWNHPLNERALNRYKDEISKISKAKAEFESSRSVHDSNRERFIANIPIPSLVLQENVGLKIFWKEIVEFNKSRIPPYLPCCLKFSNEVEDALRIQQHEHPTTLIDISPMKFEIFQETNRNSYHFLECMYFVFRMLPPQEVLPSGGNIKKRYSRKNRKLYSRKNRKRYSRKNRKRYSIKNRKRYSSKK